MKKDNIILEELAALNAGTLQNAGNNNLYTVPEGYFANLVPHIVAHTKVATISVANLYTVPKNYFETFPALILEKIHVNAAVQSFSKKQIFSVPDNYFDTISSNILQKIKGEKNSVGEELEEIAPLLHSIPKANVYSTPKGYFKNLSDSIPVQKNEPAKVVSFKRKKSWLNYAAAACIAAVLFGAGYFFTNNSSNNNKVNIAQLKDLNVQNAIAKLSDEQIDNYLNNDKSDAYMQTDDNAPTIDYQSLLNNASDQDIENYLEKNTDPGETTPGI